MFSSFENEFKQSKCADKVKSIVYVIAKNKQYKNYTLYFQNVFIYFS